jgi:hypothetical protein
MPVVMTAAERASFRRCRRQWDFGAGNRQDLEPLHPRAVPDLDRALREALAVYYFPGMWDWDRDVRLPLVGQELERALARQRLGADPSGAGWEAARQEGQALLDRYVRWAPTADRFAPVLVETDFEVTVLGQPGEALVTPGGEPIRYSGRIDLMAVDSHDAYWIVRHRVVDADWPTTEQLVADEEGLVACWAWEQFYLGMTITGTVYNELRRSSGDQPDRGQLDQDQPRRARLPWRRLQRSLPRVRQHEPSGGGRSIPQHRRMYAQAREPAWVEPVEQLTVGGFRRTWLRRTPADVTEAGRRLAADLVEMASQDLDVYPEPSDQNCPACPYLDPCRALRAGTLPIPLSGYRKRLPVSPVEGRLGGRSWGLGRGAAPPKFRRGPDN